MGSPASSLRVDRPEPGVAAAATVLAALAAIGSGCASPGSGIQPASTSPSTSAPPCAGRRDPRARDVADGARLALADAGGRVGELAGAGRLPRRHRRPRRARALERRGRGGQRPAGGRGLDRDRLPRRLRLRRDAVLAADHQPGAHAPGVAGELARSTWCSPILGAGDQVPEDIQPTGERTFGRVIPSDEAQAEAAAGWAKRLGATRVGAVSDGSRFGRRDGRGLHGRPPTGLTRRPRCGADLLVLRRHRRRRPRAGQERPRAVPAQTVIASDALIGSPSCAGFPAGDFSCPEVAGRRPRAARRARSPRPPRIHRSCRLPASGFVRAFRGRYRRAPGRYAAYGYEAMAVVLDSIRRAGDSGDDRDAVVDAFFDTQDRDSVLGTYSIDEVGDTTLDRLAGYRRHRRPAGVRQPRFACPEPDRRRSALQQVPQRRLELRDGELEAGVEGAARQRALAARRRPRRARRRTSARRASFGTGMIAGRPRTRPERLRELAVRDRVRGGGVVDAGGALGVERPEQQAHLVADVDPRHVLARRRRAGRRRRA